VTSPKMEMVLKIEKVCFTVKPEEEIIRASVNDGVAMEFTHTCQLGHKDSDEGGGPQL
jgi:hypothetical protein